MYIQTEATPNDMAVKFLVEDMTDSTMEFENAIETKGFVKKIFNIEGVKSVFMTPEFITVTKSDNEMWDVLRPQILEILLEAKINGEKITSSSAVEESISTEGMDDISKEIVELLKERVEPAVAMDGGKITFVKFDKEQGVVYLKLQGSCSGCPSSQITLQSGIKRMLQHYVPEVFDVVAV